MKYITPWCRKFRGHRKLVPLTVGDDRIVPLTVGDSKVIPMTVEENPMPPGIPAWIPLEKKRLF
jgi:hypothetical protein